MKIDNPKKFEPKKTYQPDIFRIKKRLMRLFVLATLLGLCLAIEFDFILHSRSRQCFGEMVAKDTRFRLNMESVSQDYEVHVFKPSGSTIQSAVRQLKAGFDFNTPEDGKYMFCAYSLSSFPMALNMNFTIGNEIVQPVEEENHAKRKPKSVENLVARLEYMTEDIKKEVSHIVVSEENRLKGSSNLSSIMVFSSVITIIILTILAFLQSAFIKVYLKKKKVI
jgi:hypothetical protein